jgi:hypothetical protein
MDILVKAYKGDIMPLSCPFNGCSSFRGECPKYTYVCKQDRG